MMPMIPKISVRPLATRNSSSPYWIPLRSWIRKVAASISGNLGQALNAAGLGPDPECDRQSARAELAATRGIGQRLDRDADDLVVLALDLAQIDVLHRVVCLGQHHRPA